MQIDSSTIEKLRLAISNAKGIVITTHHNPDGDAMGSALGLQLALNNMGIESNVVTPNGFPDFLTWLPGSKNITKYTREKEKASELIQKAQLIFCLDFNTNSRTELMHAELDKAKATKVLIDHHPNPDSNFDIQFSSTEVSSTAELVFEVTTALYGLQCINHNAAECLFTGIMTDTGSFSYACSRQRTFAIAGELIAKGVKVEQQQSLVFNNFSANRIRMVGNCLANKMKVMPKHKAAYITLSLDEQKEYNYQIGDTEGLVNFPLSIKGIAFSAIFVEREEFVKISLRSRGSFPVNEFAKKYYNGGGHTNAAGGKSFKSFDETIAEFEKLVAEIDDERLLNYKNLYKE